MGYRLWGIGLALLLSVAVFAEDTIAVDSAMFVADRIIMDTTRTDTAKAQPVKKKTKIYYGTQVKLDILSPVLVAGINDWTMQDYEIAVNVRLAKRWYPTLELGYAGGRTHNDSIAYKGQGGFFRVGCDLNPLKKRPDSPHALLVGLRLGTAVQAWEHDMTRVISGTGVNYEGEYQMHTGGVRADCWGEIVAGCQVEIAKVKNTAFYMGWMGRFKALFTRTLTPEVKATIAQDQTDHSPYMPIYIPGYGTRDNISWGFSYFLGWYF